MINWLTLLIALGVFQSLFLGSLLLTATRRNLSIVLLGALLIVEAICLMEQFIFFSDTSVRFAAWVGWSYPLSVLRPPLLLLFVASYFNPSFRWRKAHMLHVVPFLLYAMLFFPFILMDAEEKVVQIQAMEDMLWSDSAPGITFFIVNNLIYSGYFIFSLILVRKAMPLIRQGQDRASMWVARIVVFFASFFGLRVLLYLLNGFHLLSSVQLAGTVMLISSFSMQGIAWFLLRDMRWPQFNPTETPRKEEIKQLTENLIHKKMYLDDSLTLNQLASSTGIPSSRLSIVIRLHYQRPFKEVINALRIDEAKSLLQQEIHQQPNLLGIASESGFNNKVTFYRAFKKHEGCAPSDYLKKLRSNENKSSSSQKVVT